MGIFDSLKIGSKIKEYREKQGIKQKEMAKRLSIPPSTYANYENDHRKIPEELMSKIGKILNVNFDIEVQLNKLENSLRIYSTFEKYLQSIGYDVVIEKVRESESGYWEQHKDDNGKIIGQSWIPDEEFYEVTLTKDGKSTTFTDKEFEELQKTINKTIEYQIWLKENKNSQTL